MGSIIRPNLLFKPCKLCQSIRKASGSTRRHEARERRKKEVIQLKSEKGTPAERVYVWGHAAAGALGVRSYLRPERSSQSPVKIQHRPARLRFMDENDIQVYNVACGYGFTLFAAKRRRRHMVLATGINTDSQLGYHEFPKNTGRVLDYIIEPVPVEIPGISQDNHRSVLQVSAGRAHSVFLTEAGVFSQGNNAYGQCGRPSVEGESFHKVFNIQRVEGLPDNVSKVVCGQDHTLFLTKDGKVYSCGLGADGQLGLQSFESVGIPQQVKGDIEGVNIVDIASRTDCVLAVSNTGDVFGWGNSEYSQLAMVTTETQVNVPKYLPFKDCGKTKKVGAGGSVCILLNESGHVHVWGYGVLGKGPNVTLLKTPSLLPPPLFGCNELNPYVNVKDISCGMSHFGAITSVGDLYTWGKGKYGCLGIHKTEVQYFPLKVAMPALTHTVECGVDHTVALCRSFA
ncbi:RCC1-like G exchanging factor-like protein isoform X2 [Ruditapes philippinarum]|nr:RCC1-like G exchanging factor-like protein isoform X2 [Ruditapes philippinarum]XP_060579339.1 RCC1-like G exchanging factor-like protein isoform X2 [Ruditapes philippinarum]XP_060579340.1 RCC1-like G exchanging factor-like protein isoform X2 [Ruditapes philippinarum]